MTDDRFTRFVERRSKAEVAALFILAAIAIFVFGMRVGKFAAWVNGAA